MEDKNLNHLEMKRLKEAARQANEARYLRSSKDRLKGIIERKFTTSMIGTLKRIENYFGFLWAHGKADEELTDKEQQMKEIWQMLRVEILDLGHGELRAIVEEEFPQYTIKWDKYKTSFIVKDVKKVYKENNNE